LLARGLPFGGGAGGEQRFGALAELVLRYRRPIIMREPIRGTRGLKEVNGVLVARVVHEPTPVLAEELAGPAEHAADGHVVAGARPMDPITTNPEGGEGRIEE